MFRSLLFIICLSISSIGYSNIPVHAGGPYPESYSRVGYTRVAWGGFLYDSPGWGYGFTAPYPNIVDDADIGLYNDVNTLYLATPHSNPSNFGGVWFTRWGWGGWYFNAATYGNLPFNGSPTPILILDPNAGLMSHNQYGGYDIIATNTLYDSNSHPQYYVLAYTKSYWGGVRYVWISADFKKSGIGLLTFTGGNPILDDSLNCLAVNWQASRGNNIDNSPKIEISFWRDGWAGPIKLNN